MEEFQRQFPDLRVKLIRFFARRGCREPDDAADETLSRVMEQIQKGLSVPPDELGRYTMGVARYVRMEGWRDPRHEELKCEAIQPEPVPPHGLNMVEREILLEECLKEVSAADRELLYRYLCEDRKKLAASRGLTPNALRIRIHRILEHLRGSLADVRRNKSPHGGMEQSEEDKRGEGDR
jgi:DNA-directed RNA polymerase specialized sigma24 family protein